METQMLMFLAMCSAIGPKELIELCGPIHPTSLRYVLVKYGAGITQMSGSIGGATAARNRFGNYWRSRTKPINPKSWRQMGARIAIMFLAEQWREDPMDDTKRGKWETYANSVNWQNKLGETVKLTGFNMFIRANAALLRCGGTIVTDGPEDLGLPAGDPVFDVLLSRHDIQQYTVRYDETMDWCGEVGGYMCIEMGMGQNPTRNFYGGPWRFSNVFAGAANGGLTGETVFKPSAFALNTGQKVWYRAQIIRADGRLSTKMGCEPDMVEAT